MIYIVLAGVAALASASAGVVGYSLGKDSAVAAQHVAEVRYKQEVDDANRATAMALAQLEREQNEWDQRLQKELQSKTIYRDCRSGADAVRLFNSRGLPAKAARPEPTGSGVLPGAGNARR